MKTRIIYSQSHTQEVNDEGMRRLLKEIFNEDAKGASKDAGIDPRKIVAMAAAISAADAFAKRIAATTAGEKADNVTDANAIRADKYAGYTELRDEVDAVVSKNDNLRNQVDRVINMSDAEFDPKKAIKLARTLTKAKLEGISLVGRLEDLEMHMDGDARATTNMVAEIVDMYAAMISDLEDRYAAFYGIVFEDDESDEDEEDEFEDFEENDDESKVVLDAVRAALAQLRRK